MLCGLWLEVPPLMWRGSAMVKTVRHRLGVDDGRGAVVPFENPALLNARICEDEREGLIALLRDFADNGAIYIVPWADLPKVVPLSVHDAALHRVITETGAITPEAIVAAVHQVAATGALGPEAAAKEKHRAHAENRRQAELHAVLLFHLLESTGANIAALIGDPSRREAPEAKAAVAHAAKRLGMPRPDLYDRTGALAKLLLPVGFAARSGPVAPGWLRGLHLDIEGFSTEILARADVAASEVVLDLQAVGQAAAATTSLSGTVLGLIDRAILDPRATMTRWENERVVLKRAVDRLWWTLDAWPDLLRLGHDALRGPPGELPERLPVMRAVLPKHQPQKPAAAPPPAPQAGALAGKLSGIWSRLGGH